MFSSQSKPRAGRYAEQRYRALVDAEWRPRIRKASLIAVVITGATAAVYWALFPEYGLLIALFLGGLLMGWVNAVVVIHGHFGAGVARASDVTFVRADRLTDWLRARPSHFLPDRVHRIAYAIERFASEGDRG